MDAAKRQYWAFRVHRKHLADLEQELEEGRLRQGWGSEVGQDLRNMIVDGGARRNRRMREQVKQGDRILIPHLPRYGQITIAEATEDWLDGYTFRVWDRFQDYGHIFPAKRLRNFSRTNANVPAPLRDTFRNPSRFWNVNHLADHIEHLWDCNPG
jgi:predicted SPOUT superfamily RNA methylase MTH1